RDGVDRPQHQAQDREGQEHRHARLTSPEITSGWTGDPHGRPRCGRPWAVRRGLLLGEGLRDAVLVELHARRGRVELDPGLGVAEELAALLGVDLRVLGALETEDHLTGSPPILARLRRDLLPT